MNLIDFESIKQTVNILDVASRLGIEADRNGKALCPFHQEKRKSFSLKTLNNGIGVYKCFSCDAKGDVIKLVREIHNLDTMGAVKWLNEAFHLGLRFGRLNKEEKKALRQEQKERAEDEKLLADWDAEVSTVERQLCFLTQTFNQVKNNKRFHYWGCAIWELALKYDEQVHYYLDFLQFGNITAKWFAVPEARTLYKRILSECQIESEVKNNV